MAHIPLMNDQDPEIGEAPNYDDVRNNGDTFFFRTKQNIENENAVKYAHVSIRMGKFIE